MPLHAGSQRHRQDGADDFAPIRRIGGSGRGDAAFHRAALQCLIGFGKLQGHGRGTQRLQQRRHGGRIRTHLQAAQIAHGSDGAIAEKHLRTKGPQRHHLGVEAFLQAPIQRFPPARDGLLRFFQSRGNADQIERINKGLIARGLADQDAHDIKSAIAQMAQRIRRGGTHLVHRVEGHGQINARGLTQGVEEGPFNTLRMAGIGGEMPRHTQLDWALRQGRSGGEQGAKGRAKQGKGGAHQVFSRKGRHEPCRRE